MNTNLLSIKDTEEALNLEHTKVCELIADGDIESIGFQPARRRYIVATFDSRRSILGAVDGNAESIPATRKEGLIGYEPKKQSAIEDAYKRLVNPDNSWKQVRDHYNNMLRLKGELSPVFVRAWEQQCLDVAL